MSARLDAPHDDLFVCAEAMALAGCDALASGSACESFEPLTRWLQHADPALPLRRIADGFALDAGERALLALLFAAALSEPVARRLAAASVAGGQGVPVWLAQRLIPDLRAEALTAAGALRRFGFVALEQEALRVEARVWLRDAVLDRFCGASPREPDLIGRIAPVHVHPALASDGLARQLKAALVERDDAGLSPVVVTDDIDAPTLAATVAGLGLQPYGLAAAQVPENPEARDWMARLWSRDAALDGAALIATADERSGAVLADFVDRVAGHVIVTGPRPAPGASRRLRTLPGAAPSATSVLDRWQRALGPARAQRLGPAVARVASQFRLSPVEIDAVCSRVGADLDDALDAATADRILWHAAGRVSPPTSLPGVSMVEPIARWSDLVLAPAIETALRRVEMHVRHATTVMDDWGFGERMGGRGRGVAALFAGPSGTGKTMAAEVLASSLDLRMMTLDLSQIISKYVGETSKNVAAAFALAERTGAVMVWNEGDAIWGARGSVGQATDRHANAEIGDLLQRIEGFRGFTIVTTNLRQAIDPAFLRRFRFAIDFPMPSADERLRLWQQAFPKGAPIEPPDWSALAPLPLSGGSIRNVALGAAFLAADRGTPIDACLIAAELAEELRKHDQPMPAINWGALV